MIEARQILYVFSLIRKKGFKEKRKSNIGGMFFIFIEEMKMLTHRVSEAISVS
jgi:hypothetical protein